jgi:hypothetical protein
MHLLISLLAASLASQSLAEVAEKERKRREQNARAGVEVISLSDRETTSASETREPEDRPDEPAAAYEPVLDIEEKSALERERDRGVVLEPELIRIAAMAERVDALYENYRNQCHGRFLIGRTPEGIGIPSASESVDVHLGRDWFLVLDSPSGGGTSVPTGPDGSFVLVEPPQCQSLRENLIASAREVRNALQALVDRARHERILPGVVRELREKHGLI